MLTKIKFITLATLLIMSNIAFAQIDNSFLNQTISVNKADSNCFGFSGTVFNYMRNTEYFNKIELGRTLFGYQFNPSLTYQPTGNIKISAGIFLRNDFGGENTFTQIIPTFTVKTKFNNLEMLFGTLEGATAHQIIEPMFDIARNIEHRIENGFQLKYQKPKTFLDVWINWEKFIERGSPYKEKFTAGINHNYLLNNTNNRFKIYSIIQGMLSHAGGQIDKDTVQKLTMRGNLALGLKAVYQINRNQSLAFHAYAIGYNDTGDTLINNIKTGSAFYTHLNYTYQNVQFMVSYFNGNNFIAPRGTSIYQSQSIDNASYVQKNRNLLIPRIMYNKQIFNQLKMSLRFEPVIDLLKPYFDYSYSFYLSYNFEKIFK